MCFVPSFTSCGALGAYCGFIRFLLCIYGY